MKNLINQNDQTISYVAESKVEYTTNKTKISNSSDVFNEIEIYKDKQQEHFIAIYLDGANNIIENRVITIGTVNQTMVHPREVFSPAIEKRAVNIIVAHNHPSGLLEASREDIMITKRLAESGKILGIKLLDHLIISNNGFLSLKDEELLRGDL